MPGTTEAVGKPKGPAAEGPASHSNLFAFTIDADGGQIVKVEKVDGTGARRELSDDDEANLAASKGGPTLEGIIELAFEAGIGCVLGDESEQGEAQESQEEADLRHVLLTSLMEKTSAKNLLQRDVLGSAILRTAVRQTVTLHARGAENSPGHQQPGGSTSKPRQPTSPGRP